MTYTVSSGTLNPTQLNSTPAGYWVNKSRAEQRCALSGSVAVV